MLSADIFSGWRLLTALALLFSVVPNTVLAQEVPDRVKKQIDAIVAQKRSLDARQQKIDSRLIAAIQEIRLTGITTKAGDRAAAESPDAQSWIAVDREGRINVTVRVRRITAELKDLLRSLDFQINSSTELLPVSENLHMLSGWMPFDKIEDAAGLDGVLHIRPVDKPVILGTGDVTSAGDGILQADRVRNDFGIDGSGQLVGVISDGVTNRASAQASGDLPASITVLNDRLGGDEGTAMLEIIHDLAPGAGLAFADAGTSQEDFANNILLLRDAGASVICDDIIYLLEPVYEDGVIAQTIDSVVVNDDVVFVSSAGNQQAVHYEADLMDNDGDGFHEFIPGDETIQTVLLPNATLQLVLQWNNEFGKANDDYDLFLFDDPPANVIEQSTNIQDGDDDPVEFLTFTNSSLFSTTVHIVVGEFSGEQRNFSLYAFGQGVVPQQHMGTGGTVYGHAGAANCLATGAIDASDSNNDDIEPFSAHGPTRIYSFDADGNPVSFVERLKPDHASIDGVETKIGQLGFFTNPFFGTSAASPHSAAVAALVRQASPLLTSDEVRDVLHSTAVDLGSAGADQVFGFGRIDAFNAVSSLFIQNPDISVSPASHDFGSVTIGSTAVQTFTVSNEGTVALELQAITLTGSDTSQFSILSGGTPATIQPEMNRPIEIQFNPANSGMFAASLRLESDDPDEPVVEVPLEGTGVAPTQPDIVVTPGSHNFGDVVVGGTASQLFVVGNIGDADLVITDIGLSAPDADQFALSSIQLPLTLQPGGEDSLAGEFNPSTAGQKSSAIRIESNDPDEGILEAELVGNGVAVKCDPLACDGPALVPVPLDGELFQPVTGSSGDTITVDIRMQENSNDVEAFGFVLQVDPSKLSFVAADTADLTSGFVAVNGQENPPGSGTIICGGFGATAIPANSEGAIIRIRFAVECAAGDTSDLVISDLTDDVSSFAACCNIFICQVCLSDGDINEDGTLTPGDALCAFKTFLNGGVLPASCDFPDDECELVAADVNCDGTVTPGDALGIFQRFLDGLGPEECFAAAKLARNNARNQVRLVQLERRELQVSEPSAPQNIVKLAFTVQDAAALHAFGLELAYPVDRFEFLGIERAPATAGWSQLEGKEISNGEIRIGGYRLMTDEHGLGDDLFYLLLRTSVRNYDLSGFAVIRSVDDLAGAQLRSESQAAGKLESTPEQFRLYDSYPNPFPDRPNAADLTIRFDIPGQQTERVELSIFDLNGRQVRTLISGDREPGSHEISWDGRNDHGLEVPSGVYLYRLRAGQKVTNKRLILFR